MANISLRRMGELLRTLFEVLIEHPDGLRAKDAMLRLAEKIELTQSELEVYQSGGHRYETYVRFATVECVKAGWLSKDHRRWTITESGRLAFDKLTDPEQFMRRVRKLYAEWDGESNRIAVAELVDFISYRPEVAVAFGEKNGEVSNIIGARTSIPVWFGTDRAKASQPMRPAELFGDDRSGSDPAVTFGLARVSIPAQHKEGEIERPAWWRLEFNESPDKHMIVTSVTVFSENQWIENAACANAEGLLFIHGFNVSFEEALLRTAQLAYDLKFEGVSLCYSWASAAKVLNYLKDTQTVDWSVEGLRCFLRVVAAELRLSKIHVIAHSMGNRALTRVLSDFSVGAKNAQLGQVVLAAPDMDTGLFKQLVRKFKAIAQVTLYVSKTDRAIAASQKLHAGSRAGDASPPCVLTGVVTVDVSNVGAEMFGLGHSYFAIANAVFSDLYCLIHGKSAGQAARVLRGDYYILI